MFKGRGRAAVGLCVALACGGSLTNDPNDGGSDATLPDVSSVDASLDAKNFDVTAVDAASDVDGAKDSGKKLMDAPYVDLDAATAPWAVTFGVGAILGVAVDNSKNVLVGGELDSTTNATFLVEELDQNGTQVWTVTATGSGGGNHRAWSVAYDSSGNAVAAGYTGSSLDIGSGSKGPGAFIAKFDAKGKFQWEFGPFAATTFRKVRAKSNGNVVAFGYLNGSDDYGGGTLTSGAYHAAVLVEVDSNGKYVDSKAWTGGDQFGFALAIDPWDDVFLAGTFQGTIDFGGGKMTGPTPGSNGNNLFIAELDSSGAYVKQMETQSTFGDLISELATDWKGDLVVAGITYSKVNLGGSNLQCNGAIVGMLDSSFGHLWSKCIPASWGMSGDSLPTNGAILAGDYFPGADFGQGALPPDAGVFLASFGASGTCDASAAGASFGHQELNAAAYLTWPDAIIAGDCFDKLTFSWGTVNCGSIYPEAFVARVAP